MAKIKHKFSNIDDQINFISATRKHLETNPESELVSLSDNIDLLRAVEENLITIKMWVNLPDFHRAALHVLDHAHALSLEKAAEKFETNDPEIFLESITAMYDYEPTPEAVLELVAAVALIGVARCIVPTSKKDEEVSHD